MNWLTTLRGTYADTLPDAAASPGVVTFAIPMEGGDVVMTDERERRDPLVPGNEYDVTIRVTRDDGHRILDAELLEAEVVLDLGPEECKAAWREWFQSVSGGFWETVDDIDRELRREDDDADL